MLQISTHTVRMSSAAYVASPPPPATFEISASGRAGKPDRDGSFCAGMGVRFYPPDDLKPASLTSSSARSRFG